MLSAHTHLELQKLNSKHIEQVWFHGSISSVLEDRTNVKHSVSVYQIKKFICHFTTIRMLKRSEYKNSNTAQISSFATHFRLWLNRFINKFINTETICTFSFNFGFHLDLNSRSTCIFKLLIFVAYLICPASSKCNDTFFSDKASKHRHHHHHTNLIWSSFFARVGTTYLFICSFIFR